MFCKLYNYIHVHTSEFLKVQIIIQSAAYRMYSIKRRPSNKRPIWDKKVNKRRPRISAAVLMQRLFNEKFHLTSNSTINQLYNKPITNLFHQTRCFAVQSDCFTVHPLVYYPTFLQYVVLHVNVVKATNIARTASATSLFSKRRILTIKRRYFQLL